MKHGPIALDEHRGMAAQQATVGALLMSRRIKQHCVSGGPNWRNSCSPPRPRPGSRPARRRVT